MTRADTLARVIERIAELNADFAASGNYPFEARGLTRSQMSVLFVLSRTHGSSVAALAAKLHVTSGAVSQTVDALKALGLVTSAVNDADRRGRIIRLTDEAQVEVDVFEQSYLAAIAPRFESLSERDVDELDRILAAIGEAR